MNAGIYHEKQRVGMCALHTLNNLLQAKEFDEKSLDKICKELDPSSWINRHKSPIGVGDYDINVIELALHSKGLHLHWLDRRMDPGDINFSRVFGLIVNCKPASGWTSWIPFMSGRHWYTIRDLPSEVERTEGKFHFWKLDSSSDAPRSLGNLGSLLYFLRKKISDGNNHIVLVLTKEVAESGGFRRQKLTSASASASSNENEGQSQEGASTNANGADNPGTGAGTESLNEESLAGPRSSGSQTPGCSNAGQCQSGVEDNKIT